MRFIKAHIIPRSFFKIVRGEGKFAVEMQAKHDSLETPYRQAGVKDDAILCEDCEPRFTLWDTYGFEVLGEKRPEDEALQRASDGTPLAFELKNVNHDVLALFLLSVLWRASVSNVSFFSFVSLGSRHEERLRQYLWSNNAPPPGEYAIQLGTSLDNPYPTSILRPESCRDEAGLRFWRLYFPNVFALIKMDQREAEPLMQLGMLQQREINYMLCYPYAQSPFVHFFGGIKRRMADLRRMGVIKA